MQRIESKMTQLGLHKQKNGIRRSEQETFDKNKNIVFCVVKYVKMWIHDIQVDGTQGCYIEHWW